MILGCFFLVQYLKYFIYICNNQIRVMARNYFLTTLLFSLFSLVSFAQDGKQQGETLGFYPNPVSNNEVFISTLSELKSIVLYNINGQIIQEIKNPSKINEAYKVSNLPKGFYLIQLASENESITRKIMVD